MDTKGDSTADGLERTLQSLHGRPVGDGREVDLHTVAAGATTHPRYKTVEIAGTFMHGRAIYDHTRAGRPHCAMRASWGRGVPAGEGGE